MNHQEQMAQAFSGVLLGCVLLTVLLVFYGLRDALHGRTAAERKAGTISACVGIAGLSLVILNLLR